MSKIFEQLAQMNREMVKAMVQLPEITTYCGQLNQEVLSKNTEHFRMIDLHYTFDGLLVTYLCSLDGKTYSVKITPGPQV